MANRIGATLRRIAPRRSTAWVFTLTACCVPALAAPDATRCASLQSLKLANTQITTAEFVPADATITVGPPFAQQKVPVGIAHCLVRGEIGRHRAADGQEHATGFEIRMPEDWNGRLLFQGGGGLDGTLIPAVGQQGPMGSRGTTALSSRFVVVSSDGGHRQRGPFEDGSFGRDPEALADYQYRSTRISMDAARAVLRAYYRRKIAHSYFQGCSNGGREGLIAAQRYPEYFDGVIAGAPAFNLTKAMVGEAWNTVTFAAIAPTQQGRPDLPRALTDADLERLARGIRDACDSRDGLTDGLVDGACPFDPASLACATQDATDCLSAEKIDALRKANAGPRNSAGESLYSDWPWDPGIASPGWRMWILGNAQLPAINTLIFPAAINGVALAGQSGPPIDIFRFDFDSDPKRVGATSAQLDAVATDYTGFRRGKGRLLLYTGMSDPVFSANDLERYYRDVTRSNGGEAQTRQFARLFLIPGMNHCGGGSGLDDFDTLTAIVDWVEKGTAPERLVARGAAFPARTRPHCAYPARPRYSGTGSTEDAANFVCK